MKNPIPNENIAVLGLGQFGMSVVRTLSQYGVNILACDVDESRLAEATQYATHVVHADIADENALKELGLGNFDVVILATGDDFEASLVATMLAKEEGAGKVIAKARGLRQKKILLNIGADEVVLPEMETGIKLAHKITGPNIVDILGESDLYEIAEITPMPEWIGKTVRQADIRRKNNMMILAARRGDHLSIPVSPDKVIEKDDVLIILRENR